MSRKKCKRKVWALVDPIQHAIQGAAITTQEDLNKLREREKRSIEAFRTGKATKLDWQNVTDFLNLAETMAKRGVGPEVLPACKEAQEALIDAATRYEKTGRMGMTGPGLHAIGELFEWHDLQRTSISRSEYENHIKTTINRIRSRSAEVIEL